MITWLFIASGALLTISLVLAVEERKLYKRLEPDNWR